MHVSKRGRCLLPSTDLAVKTPDWGPPKTHVQEFEIKAGTQVQDSTVGPQIGSDGKYYVGGGNQVEPLVPASERKNVLIPIGPAKALPKQSIVQPAASVVEKNIDGRNTGLYRTIDKNSSDVQNAALKKSAGTEGPPLSQQKTKSDLSSPGVEDAEAGGYSQYDKYKKQPDPKVYSDWSWPDNKGFIGRPTESILPVGTRIDRFGKPIGSFLSPEGISYEARALAPGTKAEKYHVYEVKKTLPVLMGEIAPAFDEVGGGLQMLPNFPQRVNIEWLIKNEYLVEVK